MTSEISLAPELIYYCEFDPENWEDRLEITFSNEHKIASSWKNSDFLITLDTLKEKHKGFFGENIIDISAIAGKNGVGKTHLLKNIYRLKTSYIICLYRKHNYFFVDRKDKSYRVFLNDKNISAPDEKIFCKLLFYNIPDIPIEQDYEGIRDTRYRVVKNNLAGLYRFLVKKDFTTKEFDRSFNITQRSSITCSFSGFSNKNLENLENLVGKETLTAYWRYVSPKSGLFTAKIGLILLEICLGFFDIKGDVKQNVVSFFRPEIYKKLSMIHMMSNQKELIASFFPSISSYRKDSIEYLFAWGGPDYAAGFRYDEFNNENWRINTNEFSSEFYNFLQGIEDITPLQDYISIKLGEFSSGEMAILYQLSVLAGRIERNIKEEGKSHQPRSMIMFIDEYENNLHPEWARRYLNYLLAFLNDYVNCDRNLFFQIIITTHSPYLISDLPKENIRLIQKNEKTGRRAVSIPKHGFASNYYDILSDSFFLEDTIGEFAKQKINGWITELNELEESSDSDVEKLTRIDELKALIHIVDDQFIRNKLLGLAEEVKGKIERKDNKDLQKILLDQQIAELQKQRNALDLEDNDDQVTS